MKPQTAQYTMTPKQETKRQKVLTNAHHEYEKGLNSHAFFKVHDHKLGEDLVQDNIYENLALSCSRGENRRDEGFSLSHS